MVYTKVRAVFTTYVVVTNKLLVGQQVGPKKKVTELTTVVSYGTGTQQKTVS